MADGNCSISNFKRFIINSKHFSCTSGTRTGKGTKSEPWVVSFILWRTCESWSLFTISFWKHMGRLKNSAYTLRLTGFKVTISWIIKKNCSMICSCEGNKNECRDNHDSRKSLITEDMTKRRTQKWWYDRHWFEKWKGQNIQGIESGSINFLVNRDKSAQLTKAKWE